MTFKLTIIAFISSATNNHIAYGENNQVRNQMHAKSIGTLHILYLPRIKCFICSKNCLCLLPSIVLDAVHRLFCCVNSICSILFRLFYNIIIVCIMSIYV